LLPNWQESTGTPTNIVREPFPQRKFQLVPLPTGAVASTLIYSETRDTLPVYLQLPVALLILDHEYRRASDHQNTDIADACKALGTFLITIVVQK
jgi:hypothetical protein